jgi:uncharacterized protein YegL
VEELTLTFKLSLAATAGLQDDLNIWYQLFRCCVLELGANKPDKFAEVWYRQQTEFFRVASPRHFEELLGDTDILSIVAMRGDESLLLALSRVANDLFLPKFLICPQIADWLPERQNDGQFGMDAVLREVEFHSAEDVVPVASGEVVLVVRQDYLDRWELDRSWQSVLKHAAQDESFHWVRPRGQSLSGGLIEWALDDIFGDGENSTAAKHQKEALSSRVFRYAQFDADAADIAVDWDVWKVDALIAKRHAVPTLFDHLVGRDQPVIISYRIPLLVGYGLEISRRGSLRNCEPYLRRLCSSDALIERLPGIQVNPMEAAAEIVAAMMKRPIKVFGERAIAVSLVVDVSTSMEGEKLEAAKHGLAAFLGFLSSDRNDAVGIVTFSDTVSLPIPMGRICDVGESVEMCILGLHAGGWTALLDAVLLACDQVTSWTDRMQAVVILTDGHDNRSTTSWDDLESRLLNATDTPVIFALAYGDDADYALLSRLANLTRGKVFRGSVLNIADLYQHLIGML